MLLSGDVMNFDHNEKTNWWKTLIARNPFPENNKNFANLESEYFWGISSKYLKQLATFHYSKQLKTKFLKMSKLSGKSVTRFSLPTTDYCFLHHSRCNHASTKFMECVCVCVHQSHSDPRDKNLTYELNAVQILRRKIVTLFLERYVHVFRVLLLYGESKNKLANSIISISLHTL